MPLLSVWKSNPAAVGEFSIEQVVGTAGDGALRDESLCSQEIRTYFAEVTSGKLATYIEQCLASRFEKSGMVLQDLINEIGRRLDYKVTNGRYQGTTNRVGFDGIWVSPEGQTIITEVKTTDAYRIALDTIARYRQKLLAANTITGEPSILIVVGRQDTGELEAQVRGSRHAWDIRLISAEALIKLAKLKENSDELETGRKIRSVLMPMEYTRLDRLVDVMFTTATDIEPDIDSITIEQEIVESEIESTSEKDGGAWDFTNPALLQKKRDKIVLAVSKKINSSLIKKSRALYWNANHDARIACTISKRYTRRPSTPYWYAYHPQWDDFLAEGSKSYLVLGCMDLQIAFLIPRAAIHAVLGDLNTTTTEKGPYWHLHIVETAPNVYELLIPKRASNLPLAPFQVEVTE